MLISIDAELPRPPCWALLEHGPATILLVLAQRFVAVGVTAGAVQD